MSYEFSMNKIWVKSLALSCPFEEARPGCPLEGLRELDPTGRLFAVETMPEKFLAEIVERHKKCMKERRRQYA